MRQFVFGLLLLATGSLMAADIEDFMPEFRGTGKKVSVYRYFRNLAHRAKGIAVVSTAVRANASPFFLPELYPMKSDFEDILKKFCRLFPIYQFRFSGEILNIFPGKTRYDVLGDGRALSPGEWFTAGGKLAGRKIQGVWEPAAGHTRINFRIPLYWVADWDGKDAARRFCAFFTGYDFRIRKHKVYVFPTGEWPRVAKKYGEPLVVVANGLTGLIGYGGYLHGGYAFRFSRFIVEPRLGVALEKHDDLDSGMILLPSLSASWCAIYEEDLRIYFGLSFFSQLDLSDSDKVARVGLVVGWEFRRLFGEALLVKNGAGKFRPHMGFGWRF